MALDIPTLFVTSSATAGFIGLLFLFLGLRPQPAPGLFRFGIAYLLGALCVVLLGARGAVPDRLSIDVANALLLGCYGLIWSTTRAFMGRGTPLLPLLVGPLLWLAACQFPAFYDSLNARVMLVALLSAGYCLWAAWELGRGEMRVTAARWIALLLMALHGLVFLVRIPLSLMAPLPGTGPALPSGTWYTVLSLESLLHLVGLAFALLAMAKERAEAVTRQSLVAARDAAAQASEAKSRFLARMSHELRTPLNSVLGLAQGLVRDQRLLEDQRQQVVTLERAGQHLLAVANDVLELATVEAGKLQLRLAPLTLAPFVESCLGIARPQAAAKRITLTSELAAGLPAAVVADATRLRQVLLNLLSNAVKFTPEGGRVRLTLQPAAFGGLRFEVLDTGPGIPPERRAQLFRDFSRIEPSLDHEFGGSGLGLAISAALVAAMQGRIGCEAGEGGQGSRFYVELALPESAPPAEPVLEDRTPRASLSRRVLVVDDLAPNRLVARILLESAGHEVVLAGSGAEAVEAARTGGFDLVLMDIHMPGMDGIEATRRIREAEGGGPRVRVVALTADTLSEQISRCRAAGMDGYLLKPIDRAALLAVVDGAEPAMAGPL